MKANELRIGNLVTDRGGKTLRVNYFDRYKVNQVMYIGDNEVHPLTEEFCFCKPIPLTEEWLLKFGFEKDLNTKSNYFKRINEDYLTIYKEGLWSIGIPYENGGTDMKINHVHQLQNLYFALTGEELEIKE